MGIPISQKQAADLFDIPEVFLYVCDGKKPCGKQCCIDYSRTDCCHHTEDESHALYLAHVITSFARYPAVSEDGEAAVICVEPIRG
jgi:hypothetical protein